MSTSTPGLIDASVPVALRQAMSGETPEFAVKAKRAYAPASAIATFLFGLAWTGFTSIFVAVLLVPILLGKSMRMEINGVPTTVGPGNYGELLIPGLIVSLFVLIGIGMISFGLYRFFAQGGWFVGTRTRLICFRKGMRSIDWEQFSGDIQMLGDDAKGTLLLQMRTGRMVSRRHGGESYVPDVIAITGIPRVTEIERICRTRIKENDPTPLGVTVPSTSAEPSA